MKIYYFAWKNGKKTDENRKQEWTELTAKEYKAIYGRTTTKKILNWLESHSDPAKTTLKDLICTESMSMEEMLYVFDFLSQSFYHSDEYNSRKYLYGSIRELSYMTDHV